MTDKTDKDGQDPGAGGYDPDDPGPGSEHPESGRQDPAGLPPQPVPDPGDRAPAGDDLTEIERAVKKRAEEMNPCRPDATLENKLSSKFVRECLHGNETGDGILYATLLRGRFVYNKRAGEWLRWTGHYWELDIMDDALAAVEDVAMAYRDEALVITAKIAELSDGSGDNNERIKGQRKLQGKLFTRMNRLRTVAGCNTCLKFSHSNKQSRVAISGDELDAEPWLLPCKNGVIDLRTGELRDGRPEDWLHKACPHEFTGIDTPAPNWQRSLLEIFSNRQHMVDYMQRLLGYAITGLTTEHVLPILWGKGRNGKGTIVETIQYVLGPLAAPIRSEMLLDQGRAQSSSGPSPDIMALRGLRLVFASESDEGRRFSPSKVKWLSGGDTLVGRFPHDKRETVFQPTHTLLMLTNDRPHAPAGDFAFWERCHLVEFKLSFVKRDPVADDERPADLDLAESLKAEASGILAWLVRGCLEWQRRGLDPPQEVADATRAYKRHEDDLADWLDECCLLDPAAETPASDLYTNFRGWWELNVSKKYIPTQKKFGGWMRERFKSEKKGIIVYYGVCLVDEHGQQHF